MNTDKNPTYGDMFKSGRIKIFKCTPEDWEQPLPILGRGNFMGEIPPLEETNHGTDALALDPAESFF